MKKTLLSLLLLIPTHSWAYKPAFQPLNLEILVQSSDAILVVIQDSPFMSTNKINFKCGLRRIPLEYTVDHYVVEEILFQADKAHLIATKISVNPADWDKHGDISLMYNCPKSSPHPSNFYYDRKSELEEQGDIIIFVKIHKGVYSYTMLNARENMDMKYKILSLIPGP